MLEFFLEHWIIEAIAIIASGIIVIYGICWLFEQCEGK